MQEINYKSNSNKSKTEELKVEERRVEKVVTGKVLTKKKSGLSKFTEEFISEDAKNIKTYVFGEVLIPAIKKAISDIVTDGIDMILYGGQGGQGRSRRSSADKISYKNYYDDRNRGGGSRQPERPGAGYNNQYSYDDIILNSRGEAEDVLSRMDELMDSYGLVRVADLKDLVGITGNYTDNKWGWTSIRNAEIIHVRDGWVIKMPRAVAID
jgi:hypothetical protein